MAKRKSGDDLAWCRRAEAGQRARAGDQQSLTLDLGCRPGVEEAVKRVGDQWSDDDPRDGRD